MTARVPFLDLALVNSSFRSQMVEAFQEVLISGCFLRGEMTARFERDFSDFCGVAGCVAVANGLDALTLALEAWVALGRLQRGDEVVVPANSFVASALAVTRAGLTIRFADVDPSTLNVTADTIDRVLSKRTRAVMPVHLYGHLANMNEIIAYCRSRRLLILEDAAQAHGARRDGRRAGSFGDAAAFSFYPTKNLGALGDAGCVVSDDLELLGCVRTLANYGSASRYVHTLRGTNSRISELDAAVLSVKLKELDSDNERRRVIAGRYLDGLVGLDLDLPAFDANSAAAVWHLFVVRTKSRDALAQHLSVNGVETLIHYPTPIPMQGAFVSEFGANDYPTTRCACSEVLSLPISPRMSFEAVDLVTRETRSWLDAYDGVRRG